MLFVQYDVSLTQGGQLPLDCTFKEKNNIYNANQHYELRQCVLLLHFMIRCPDSCSFSLVDLQFFPSSCGFVETWSLAAKYKRVLKTCRFESSEMLTPFCKHMLPPSSESTSPRFFVGKYLPIDTASRRRRLECSATRL